MIVDGNNVKQRNILINKCFYLTTVKIMDFFASRGDADYADKTIEAIAAYHDAVHKKKRVTDGGEFGSAFAAIDNAIRGVANKVFYIYGSDSYNKAYDSFRNYDYIRTIQSRLRDRRAYK